MNTNNHEIEQKEADELIDVPLSCWDGSHEESMADSELKSLLRRWQSPHPPRALDQRVMISYRAQTARLPLWRRILTTSISVPIPVAAAMVAVMVLGTFVLTRKSDGIAQQEPIIVERIRIVEVPRVEEKVVTRIVYRNRSNEKTDQDKQSIAPQNISLTIADEENAKGYITGADLAGFQPNREMNLKVIRKTDENEK